MEQYIFDANMFFSRYCNVEILMTLNNITMEHIEFRSNSEIHIGNIENGAIAQYNIYFPTLRITLYLTLDKDQCEYLDFNYNGPILEFGDGYYWEIYSNRVKTVINDTKIPIRWKFSHNVVDYSYQDMIIENIVREQTILEEYELYLMSIIKSENENIKDYHNVMIYDVLKYINTTKCL